MGKMARYERSANINVLSSIKGLSNDDLSTVTQSVIRTTTNVAVIASTAIVFHPCIRHIPVAMPQGPVILLWLYHRSNYVS